MVSGAIAGVAARTVSAPIDLLKIRFQMSRLSAAATTTNMATRSLMGSLRIPIDSPYGSIISAIRSVYRNEGVFGFWKGNMAGIYLYATYSAVQFGTYEELLPLGSPHTSLSKGMMGAIAAMGATFASYPFDLIRTRHSLQGDGIKKHYNGILPTIRIIYQEEGLRGFYKGLGPSLGQVMPYMGLAFASFDWAKRRLEHRLLTPRQSDILAGAFSGLFSKFCLIPVDVIRKRMQIQGSPYRAYILQDLPVYRGLLDCVRSIWRIEGVRGYFSGLSLALLKSVPATTTTFVIYGLLNRMP